MNDTLAAWIVLGAAALILVVAIALVRWRGRARKAYGPRGVGEALERGRRRARNVHRDS